MSPHDLDDLQDEDLDVLLGELGVLTAPPVRASSRPWANLLAHLSGVAPFVGFAARLAGLFQIEEAEAVRLLRELGRRPPWEPFLPVAELLHVTPGPALRRPEVDAGFVRFAAGTTFPEHLHQGEERTLVLQGGFKDPISGRHLRPGDTLVLPAGSSHGLRIDPGEPCLSAVLLLGPISFRGLFLFALLPVGGPDDHHLLDDAGAHHGQLDAGAHRAP